MGDHLSHYNEMGTTEQFGMPHLGLTVNVH